MTQAISREMRDRAVNETAALIDRLTHPGTFASDLARRAADPNGGREAVFAYLHQCLADGELLSPALLAVGILTGEYRLDPRYNPGISPFRLDRFFDDPRD